MNLLKKKYKTGLALGSGAARGFAHIGVLKALKENNIPVDIMAGSSMGALVGACYARDGDITDLEEIVLNLDWKQLAQLADPNLALLFKGVIHGKKVKELLKTIIGDVKFKDLKIPLAVVATDVTTGEEVVIKEGSVIEAVRASISIPAIFMPVKFRNRFLIDGGIVNPVPVKVAKDMGAEFVIACNVINDPAKRIVSRSGNIKKKGISASKAKISNIENLGFGKNAVSVALNDNIHKFVDENKDKFDSLYKFVDEFKGKIYKGASRIDSNMPSLFETVIQAIYAMEHEIAKLKIKSADIVITPDVSHIVALEFHRGKEAIEEGYKKTKEIILKEKALNRLV